ncbi:OLC1v1036648C1 [Oldenlandia corymbosa var. corymbosa]|uniref:OLC1v1036648C1 n=1 Tax=Oldenlandia corymbosa var. corymbosa TaxID=529605 RepID=A0AAV1CZ14_OLDCO|nr:OLC1v1036648C1 [Oldenlandia corymbosa var. corymbosa]
MRSQDSSSRRRYDLEQQSFSANGLPHQTSTKPSCSAGMITAMRKRFRMKALEGSLNSRPTTQIDGRMREEKSFGSQGTFLLQWNKIVFISCIIAVSLDPLFFYIPVIDNNRKCLDMDNKLKIIACVLRSIMDVFYTIHILRQFHTRHLGSSSRAFERVFLVEDSCARAKRFLSSWSIVDILAVLPLPQVVVLVLAPKLHDAASLDMKKLLEIAVLLQYVPRLVRICPLYKEVTRKSGLFAKSPWSGAACNLFLYMLASNALGAFWYLLTIERVDSCWRESCAKHHCDYDALNCGVSRSGDYSFLYSSCPLLEPNEIKHRKDFNFGMFLEALQSELVEKHIFWKKFFYGLWWGLRNLSSLGQNLRTSNSVGESLLAISILIAGLVLYALLIGNMQKYLQPISGKIEEMQSNRRNREMLEHWMSRRMLPENLRRRIVSYENYKWQETRGVEEDALIKNLPNDLRRDIIRHRWALLAAVPIFAEMDQCFLYALCDRLKQVFYTKYTYIYHEGDLVDEMLFLTCGDVLSMTTTVGGISFFPPVRYKRGDFWGDELLAWALYPSSSSLPISTRTVQAMDDVEAFALRAEDLRFVASQFRHQLNSEQVQHIFRFYSQQWRTWAACYIQGSWHRHKRRKLEKSLREEEEKLQGAWPPPPCMHLNLHPVHYSKFTAYDA